MQATTTNRKGAEMQSYYESQEQQMPEDTVGPIFAELGATMKEVFAQFAAYGINPDDEDVEEQASRAGIHLGNAANPGVCRSYEGSWYAWAEGPEFGNAHAVASRQAHVLWKRTEADVF